MHPARATYLILLALTSASPAFAGPPFITDDTGTPERGAFEFRLGASYEAAEGEDALTAPEFELAYGLTERIELSIGGAVEHALRTGKAHSTGFGDAAFGVKIRLIDQANGTPFSLTTAPSISAPTGSERKGFSNGEWAGRLPIIFGWESRDWAVFAEAGWSKIFDGSGRTGEVVDTGFLVQRQLTERLNLGAEIHGDHERAPGGRSAWIATFGMIFDVSETVALMGNVGAGIDDDAPDATGRVVLQVVF